MPKTALITGCSSGIGRAATELMARRGWQVAASARHPATLRDMAGLPNAVALSLDVTDDASITAAVAAVVERFGRIDALVNNAGYGLWGPLEGATREQIERQFQTNVFGLVALTRAVMPIMRRQRSGTIVNVSSVGGRMAAPFASFYHATKFAVEGLSDAFRHEAALHGILVKLVEPGHFKTWFFDQSLVLAEHPAYETAVRNYMAWVLKEDRKAPGPEPVARAILRAAEDPSPRLRYPVGGAMILAMTRILPDVVWRSLLREGMKRRPSEAGGG